MSKEFDPEKMRRFPMLFVRRDSPATHAIMRATRRKATPGAVFFVSDEEFESLQVDVLGFNPEGDNDGTQ